MTTCTLSTTALALLCLAIITLLYVAVMALWVFDTFFLPLPPSQPPTYRPSACRCGERDCVVCGGGGR